MIFLTNKNRLDWWETSSIKYMAAAQPNIFGNPSENPKIEEGERGRNSPVTKTVLQRSCFLGNDEVKNKLYWNCLDPSPLCQELTDHHYSSPNSYSSSIIRKVIVDQQLGGVISDNSAPLYADYIDVSDKNLKKLNFRITDEKSNTLNLYDIPVQFWLIFEHPSY